MTEAILGAVIGGGVVVVVWLLFKRRGTTAQLEIRHAIMQLKAVGELTVFKLVSQQIVTAEEHAAGAWRDWVKWLVSSKKLAVIIEYGIDFKFDLRDPTMQIDEQAEGTFKITLPPCVCQTYIRDIKFYDEQNARWLPWLLGDVTEIFGPGFDETAKNRMLEAARKEADQKARGMVSQLQSEVHTSARQTLEQLARGFGARHVDIVFSDSKPVQTEVSIERVENVATN